MAKTAIVLGAGIQGICVALMLEAQGYRVELVDKSSGIMNRASLNYEGRIHLGFVYGMDKSQKTGQRMVLDALNFAPYLEKLIGDKIDWLALCSKPTDYFVARDTILPADQVERYFENIQSFYCEQLDNKNLNYLGQRPKSLFQRISIPSYFNADRVTDCFRTTEFSVDQLKIKKMLQRALSQLPQVNIRLQYLVESIEKEVNGYIVRGKDSTGENIDLHASIVVNCLWEKRAYFDQQLGLEVEKQSIRLKYGIVVALDDFLSKINSFAMVLGANGNFVCNPRSNTAFFAWYPSCLRGLMEYGEIPEDWDRVADGFVDPELYEILVEENLRNFKELLPGLRSVDVIKIKGGMILGPAGKNYTKDIDQPDSVLHTRSESPIRQSDGYYSISTGKFTSAPRNTLQLEQIMREY